MTKQKKLTALFGAVATISSMFSPNEALAYGLVAMGATITSLMLIPLLSLTINPIVDQLLSTKFGELLGKKGRLIFRVLFTVPNLTKRKA